MNEENKNNLESASNNEALNGEETLEVNQTKASTEESINNTNLNEIAAPGTTLGVNPPSENTSPNNNEVKPKNNKKKIIIIISIIIGVILLAIIALFVYIKVSFNAGKYLDEKLEEFTTGVNEVFSAFNLNSNSDDVRYQGTLKANTNIAQFTGINNATIDFTANYSLVDKIIDLNFDVLNVDTSILNGELYLNENRLVLDSNISDTPLYMDITSTTDTAISQEELMNVLNDANYFINKFATFIASALKETALTTKIDGLTAKYTYEVNDNNKDEFANKMNELIGNDTEFKSILEELLGEDDPTVKADNIEDFTFYIETKIPSGDVQIFFVVIDKETIMSGERIDDNTLRIYIGEDYEFDIITKGDEVTINWEIDSENTLNITYNEKSGEINGTIVSDDTTIAINSNKKSDNEAEYTISLTDNYFDTLIEASFTKNNNNLVGYLLIQEESEEIKIDFDVTLTTGNDFVSEKTFDNAKDINSLTFDEQAQIEANLQDALAVFFGDLIANTNQDEFLGVASTLIDDASAYLMTQSILNPSFLPSNDSDTTCITVDELIAEGYTDVTNEYSGKIEITKNGNLYDYKISLTDGQYMLLNQESYNITSNYLENYDATRFNQEYYTCS